MKRYRQAFLYPREYCCKYERLDATDDAKEVITVSGGWITDYRMFSNRSICLQFEIASDGVMKLYNSLNQTRLHLTDDTHESFASLSVGLSNGSLPGNTDLKGTLQITFVHDEPDLILDIPPLEL